MVAHPAHCASRLPARRVQSHVPQQHQRVAGLAIGGIDIARIAALAPLPVGCLTLEQPGAPAFGGDTRTLGGYDVVGLAGQIAHRLPTDRGVGIQQPLHDSHGSCLPHLNSFTNVRNSIRSTSSYSQIRREPAPRSSRISGDSSNLFEAKVPQSRVGQMEIGHDVGSATPHSSLG